MKIWTVLLVFAPALLLASTTRSAPKHTTTQHLAKNSTKAASKTSASPRASPKASRVSSKSSRYRKSRYSAAKRPPKPSYQLHPTSERYQQIQQALADKGYFKGTVNGSWGDDSADALKRFQADNKLDNDGKINSLSLIHLGLGPKHDGSGVSTVNPELPIPPPPVTEAKPEEQQLTQ